MTQGSGWLPYIFRVHIICEGKGNGGSAGNEPLEVCEKGQHHSHSPSDGLPLPRLREGPLHKGRGREPEPWGGGSQGWGPEEGGWLEPVGLRSEGDFALIRQIFQRLPGPDSSPRVLSVPAGDSSWAAGERSSALPQGIRCRKNLACGAPRSGREPDVSSRR
ncbi:hypothetical protein LEMLEM_LOCUS10272 [Lemmus lemmus]